MKPFLTATWNKLVFANYIVDPSVLTPYLPAGTTIDLFNGKCYVSLVGFLFLDTRIRGISYPLHTNFEEFNLRFYVQFKQGDTVKRGVVFVKEIVPRRMITYVARWLYGERYYYHPMRHSIHQQGELMAVKYAFLHNMEWNHIQVLAAQTPLPLVPGSLAAFITEHYWGYTRKNTHTTSEYQVQHPAWNIHEVAEYDIACNTRSLYGDAFHEYLAGKPDSVFMADGSGVSVFGRKIHAF